MLSSNIVSDYEERVSTNKDSELVADKWLKYQDAREYAKKLTKYADDQINTEEPDLNKQQEVGIYLFLITIRKI